MKKRFKFNCCNELWNNASQGYLVSDPSIFLTEEESKHVIFWINESFVFELNNLDKKA